MIEIVKDRPMPKAVNPRGKRVYPFADMEVGDSFSVPDDQGERPVGKSKSSIRQCNVSVSARGYAKRHNLPAKFTVRKIDGEIVCWRVA